MRRKTTGLPSITEHLRNKSWKPDCVLSFNMGWRILIFYPEPVVWCSGQHVGGVVQWSLFLYNRVVVWCSGHYFCTTMSVVWCSSHYFCTTVSVVWCSGHYFCTTMSVVWCSGHYFCTTVSVVWWLAQQPQAQQIKGSGYTKDYKIDICCFFVQHTLIKE